MYPKEKKEEAIKLWLKYDKSIASTVRELEWLNTSTLRMWIKEYNDAGEFKEKYSRTKRYTEEQRKEAVSHFIEHGKCFSRTVRALGYPCRYQLMKWVNEDCPDYKPKIIKKCSIEVNGSIKKDAVITLCTSPESVNKIAADIGVNRNTIYNWKREILDKGCEHSMVKKKKTKELTNEELLSENDRLKKELADMEDKLYRAQLEYDILEKAAEIIKKDQGINPSEQLTNTEKAMVIDALRNKYSLKTLISLLNIAKSSYEYARKNINKVSSDEKFLNDIKNIFDESYKTYGYRRIHSDLKKNGTVLSEKRVRRIMKKYNLIVYVSKKKHYSSYEGEITPAVENIVDRNFHSENPFEKILTDITEFSIPAGKVYLSPAIDCFDGLPTTWTIGTSPNAELANSMLDELIRITPNDNHPIVHSDRGCHYRWPGWIERMNNAGFVRSMSKKGCSPDNAACEAFFGRLKNEFFYPYKWDGVSIEEFIKRLNDYLRWYGESRIKISLGGLSPIQYRQSLGIM